MNISVFIHYRFELLGYCLHQTFLTKNAYSHFKTLTTTPQTKSCALRPMRWKCPLRYSLSRDTGIRSAGKSSHLLEIRNLFAVPKNWTLSCAYRIRYVYCFCVQWVNEDHTRLGRYYMIYDRYIIRYIWYMYDIIRYDIRYDVIWCIYIYMMKWYDIYDIIRYMTIWYDTMIYDIFVNCNWVDTRWK